MLYENLKDYFEKYIENYAPYSDSDVHSAIVTYLKNSYFLDTYCDIPKSFKKAFENQMIDQSMYNYRLLSEGLPESILKTLTITEKKILIKSFTEYHKFKSTIYFLKKITSQLNNDLAVYELYIDRRDDKWCFVPSLVYIGNNISNPSTVVIDYPINYASIYHAADFYYITENELNNLYTNSQLSLPIKTNLLLIDFFISYTSSTLFKTFIHSIVLNHYKDYIMTIYFYEIPSNAEDKFCTSQQQSSISIFDETSYEVKLSVSQFVKLYYYIYLKYYNEDFNVIPFTNCSIINFASPTFPYTISDLPNILAEYESIQNVTDSNNFYNTYIYNNFIMNCQLTHQFTVFDLYQMLISEDTNVFIPLLAYIDDRMSRYLSINKNTIYRSILDEMRSSFTTFIYSVDEEYRNFLLEFLHELPIIQPIDYDNSYYGLLIEYKPFHTQLISNYRIRVQSLDYDNLITPNALNFIDKILSFDVSTNNISDINQAFIQNKYEISNSIISTSQLSLNNINNSILSISDNFIINVYP